MIDWFLNLSKWVWLEEHLILFTTGKDTADFSAMMLACIYQFPKKIYSLSSWPAGDPVFSNKHFR